MEDKNEIYKRLFWKLKYCKKNNLNPDNPWNWNRAEVKYINLKKVSYES